MFVCQHVPPHSSALTSKIEEEEEWFQGEILKHTKKCVKFSDLVKYSDKN